MVAFHFDGIFEGCWVGANKDIVGSVLFPIFAKLSDILVMGDLSLYINVAQQDTSWIIVREIEVFFVMREIEILDLFYFVAVEGF